GRIQGTGSNALLSVDFANIGSPTSAVALYDANGATIAGFNIQNNTSMTINQGGGGGVGGPWTPYWCFIRWRCEPARDVAVYGWCNPICLWDPFDPLRAYTNIARVEISALNISVPREYVSEGRLAASGLPSLIVTAQAILP